MNALVLLGIVGIFVFGAGIIAAIESGNATWFRVFGYLIVVSFAVMFWSAYAEWVHS